MAVDTEYSISVGSKYSIDFGGDKPVIGVFKGYSALGAETAMVFELEDGTIRFINMSQIVYLDLVKAASKPKASKKKESGSVYYG